MLPEDMREPTLKLMNESSTWVRKDENKKLLGDWHAQWKEAETGDKKAAFVAKVSARLAEDLGMTSVPVALDKGFADRKTLPQYSLVDSGATVHGRYETENLPAGEEILVYIKNIGMAGWAVEIKAGPSHDKHSVQPYMLFPGDDTVLHFKNHGDLNRYFSINGYGDSFAFEYKIYSKGNFDER